MQRGHIEKSCSSVPSINVKGKTSKKKQTRTTNFQVFSYNIIISITFTVFVGNEETEQK